MKKTSTETIGDLKRELDSVRMWLDLALMSNRIDRERLAEALDNVRAAIGQLRALEPVNPVPVHLDRPARLRSLVGAVEAIARERGSWLVPATARDALQSAVVRVAATETAREYWAGVAQDAQIVGNLMSEPDIAEQLEQRGVLAWVGEIDEAVRIVDTNWLTAHADIRSYVVGGEPSGGRCRFCKIREPDAAQELIELEGEEPSVFSTGLRLQPGSVSVHERCAEHWLRYLEIAEHYASQEEAEGADREAGRKPREQPAASVPEPEPEFPHPTLAPVRNRREHGFED